VRVKKLSLGSWAFTFGPYSEKPIPLERVVDEAARTGYQGVEVSGFPPHATLEAMSSRAQREELMEYLRQRGIQASGYVPDLTSVNPLPSANRRRYLELFRRNLEVATDLQCPAIRVDTVAAPRSIPDEDYDDAFERLAETWNEAAELSAGAGLKMVWEFEPGFVFNKPKEIVELHEKVSHPNFYILFDTAHAYTCAQGGPHQYGKPERLRGGVEGLLDLCAGRIGAVHLVDTDGSLYNDETSTHLPLGLGVVDFERLAPKLRSAGGDWWTVDLSFYPEAWTQIQASLAFARAINE
jgi:sugar phosphate isomerase/epimerase